MDLDPDKTYEYHTAYDIQPAKVVYNVNLDMNRKKILNITRMKLTLIMRFRPILTSDEF